MTDRMGEQLLGYLVGALDEQEREAVEELIARDPEVELELERLRCSMEPLELDAADAQPTPDLAARTCGYVAAHMDAAPALEDSGLGSSALSSSALAHSDSWSIRDVLVGLAVMAAGLLIFFPAVSYSRFQADVNGCQENMRQLGFSLAQFADANGDYFPQVPLCGNHALPGIYASALSEQGLLDSPQRVVCPTQRQYLQSGSIPTVEELKHAPACQSRELRSRLGTYGFVLGYLHNGQYQAVRNQGRTTFALLSDDPGYGGSPSLNHDGQGVNVLFEGGNVRFVPACTSAEVCDDYFRNDRGLVAPGVHSNDAVIAPSRTPIQFIGMQQ